MVHWQLHTLRASFTLSEYGKGVNPRWFVFGMFYQLLDSLVTKLKQSGHKQNSANADGNGIIARAQSAFSPACSIVNPLAALLTAAPWFLYPARRSMTQFLSVGGKEAGIIKLN